MDECHSAKSRMNEIKTKDILEIGIKKEEKNPKTYSQLSGKMAIKG